MSATNRGAERARDDYYITPQDTIFEFLPAFAPILKNLVSTGGVITLDPCAGGDDKNPMAYPLALQNSTARQLGDGLEIWNNPNLWFNVDTLDLRADSRADETGVDFLKWTPKRDYDLCISNPPYNLAIEFIEKGLTALRDNGYLAYLLRLNFFGSEKRKEFFKRLMPEYCFIHGRRPSFFTEEYIKELRRLAREEARAEEERIFQETGKKVKVKPKSVSITDATEYAHFVWRKGYYPKYCKTIVI